MKIREIIDRLKNHKSFGIVIILLAAGVVLVILSLGKSAGKSSVSEVQDNSFDFYEYETALEERLKEKIDTISGVSNPEVILLVETSYVYDYLKENNGKTVTGSVNGEERALTESESAPTIRGVAVICSGGDDPVVKKNIIDMLSALLGISTNKIWVGSR